jgi:hypothetical protein
MSQLKFEKKRFALLKILHEAESGMSSSAITARLNALGQELSSRTVRLYLQQLDAAGLTENLGKRGRRITARGSKELAAIKTYEKVGFMSAKIDQLTFNMTFNLQARQGTVIVNISRLPLAGALQSAHLIRKVYDAGYAMGRLLALFPPGSRVGEMRLGEDEFGISTVCSFTLNGVLLAHGIPTRSRFGGLLEIHQKQPRRFVELISYDGTTIPPLEIFIRTGMTDYIGATGSGTGRIGAGFREIPGDSRNRVQRLAQELEKAGLGGFLCIGWPGQPLMDIPVAEGRAGAVVIGGLNPIAIIEENGLRVPSQVCSHLMEYQELFPFHELETRLKHFL